MTEKRLSSALVIHEKGEWESKEEDVLLVFPLDDMKIIYSLHDLPVHTVLGPKRLTFLQSCTLS